MRSAISDATLLAQLVDGANTMGRSLSDTEATGLLGYLRLLERWNSAYNLTAVRDVQEMVPRHLLDSLSIAPWIHGPRIIDVGAGGGMPGIPLAILFPDIQWVLLDSNGKKTRFLTQCRFELKLQNLEVVHSRAEQYLPAIKFDQITSRAFASLSDMQHWCRHLLAEQGEFLAMKGQYPDDEIRQLSPPMAVRESHRLSVPGCEGERHLLIIAACQSPD